MQNSVQDRDAFRREASLGFDVYYLQLHHED